MLYTNLKHLENAQDLAWAIQQYQNVVVVCGRMEHGCIAVFRVMEALKKTFPQVRFYDMEFDNPESQVIRSLPAISGLPNIPFVVCYKNGVLVHATAGILTRKEIIHLLDLEFMPRMNA